MIGEECRGHGGDVRHVKEGTGWTEASPRIHLFHGLAILLMATRNPVRSPVEVGSLV